LNGVGHNGKLTLGENTGDNVGLAASFRAAFPEYTNGKYSQAKLQEFYQQYARAWCEVQTDSFKEMRLKVDAHSLGKERINQQVRQQEGFYEAYGCQEKDALYLAPANRVKIW
jgi:putative endopeptidase